MSFVKKSLAAFAVSASLVHGVAAQDGDDAKIIKNQNFDNQPVDVTVGKDFCKIDFKKHAGFIVATEKRDIGLDIVAFNPGVGFSGKTISLINGKISSDPSTSVDEQKVKNAAAGVKAFCAEQQKNLIGPKL